MLVPRFRIACPRCLNVLHVRFDAIGKKGDCRYCGHRFRARMGTDQAPPNGREGVSPTYSYSQPHPQSAPAAMVGEAGAGLSEWIRATEHELQESLALLTAKQTSVVERMIAALGERVVESQSLAREQLRAALAALIDPESGSGSISTSASTSTSGRFDFEGSSDPAVDVDFAPGGFVPDPWPFEVAQSIVSASSPEPVGPGASGRGGAIPLGGKGTASASDRDDAERERIDRLGRERDEARAECDRLRAEVQILRDEMPRQLAEVRRLKTASEKAEGLRSERDRLVAERDAMRRETHQLQTRLVEVQATLVQAEADLDDCRERARVERLEWQGRCQEVREQGERRLARHRDDFEAERRAWREQAEAHRRVEHEAEALRGKVRKLRGLYDATRRECDEARQQAETLRRRSGALSAYLDEAEAERLEADRAQQAEIERLASALAEALDEAESARRAEAHHAGQVRKLQAELARRELSLCLKPQLPWPVGDLE